MDSLLIFSIPGILFLFTLIFGFWLSKIGKPYHGILFNVHKLIALGAVITAVIQVLKIPRGGDPSALIFILLIVATLCVVALFASGALMSADKMDYRLLLTVHRIAPIILVLVMTWAAYLIWKVL